MTVNQVIVTPAIFYIQHPESQLTFSQDKILTLNTAIYLNSIGKIFLFSIVCQIASAMLNFYIY